MRRSVPGWVLAVTGVLACPCHLAITLPLAAALFGGTALGGWMVAHQGTITVVAAIYFLIALAAGVMLLWRSSGGAASEGERACRGRRRARKNGPKPVLRPESVRGQDEPQPVRLWRP